MSVVIYFRNITDISNKKEIVGAYFIDVNNNTLEVSLFTKLSFKHKEKIVIPIAKENFKGIKTISFTYNGYNYKTVSLE